MPRGTAAAILCQMAEFANPIVTELFPQPRWFPQVFDATRTLIRLVGLDEKDYRDATFLDRRSIKSDAPAMVVPWKWLADQVPADARRDAHWIFHISHVGSTLVSRVLDQVDGTLGLREPPILRALVSMDADDRATAIQTVRALLSRTFHLSQRAIVKATSNVSEIGADLIGDEASQALLISTTPAAFVAGRLTRQGDELRQRAPERLARLQRRLPGLTVPDPDFALLAAMAWAAESLALEDIATKLSAERILRVDFADFVSDPLDHLASICWHFGLTPSLDRLEAVVAGPVMRSVAKRPGQPFDAKQRERALAAVHRDHAESLAKAMAWLDRTARDYPALASALDRS